MTKTMLHCCLAAALLGMAACGAGPAGTVGAVADTDPTGWRPADSALLELPVSDTLTPRTLSLLIRTDRDLAATPLVFTIRTTAPDGSWFEEESPSYTPAPSGNSVGGFREVLVPWRRGVVPGRSGVYRFAVSPRTDGIVGISAVGIVADFE